MRQRSKADPAPGRRYGSDKPGLPEKEGSTVAAQYFLCIQCHKKYPTHQKLFDALYDFSKIAPEGCPACGGTRDLHVNLDFQLGAGDGDFKVVSALLPRSWNPGSERSRKR
jgi:hypothetical protein